MGIRKGNTSRLLSSLLWLAYLLADYVATFTLGRLTLHVDDPRHQLVLFWTPLLLLHLGSQETISAFSIEDAMLWKRHLLGLVSQVALAIYIVAKSWRPDKQLLGPLVLMFISGTIKYAERTWALMTASSSMSPGSDSMADHVLGVQDDVILDAKSYFDELHSIFPGKNVLDIEGHNGGRRTDDDGYEGLVMAAGKGFRLCLDFLTDMTPFLVWSNTDTIIDSAIKKLRTSNPETQVQMAYKLVEIQLSLIYDYLYTKYGALQFRLGLVSSGIERLITFFSTLAALGLFVGANLKGPFNYSREDVMVSYVLLAGAITLDISSIFMLISSYWLQLHRRGGLFGCSFSLAKCVHAGSKPLWSEKIAQYNLIDACIQEERGGIICGWVMRRTGIVSDINMSNTVSPELKKLVLDKLFEVASTRSVSDYWDWDFSKYRGMWLQWWLQEGRIQADIAQGILTDGITDTDLYFPMTVIVWHIATEMCWFADEDDYSPCRAPSMELSRYVMYLVAKRDVMSGSNGHFELGKARRQVKRILEGRGISDERGLLKYARQATGQVTEPCFGRGRAISEHLLKISNRALRWELISMLWIEMLCYLGPNCGAQFHAKHLSTGGEFVTHVRILLVVLGIPFLSSLARALQLWNEWEIQCLVLASFSLQVFLHLFSSTRKANTSRVLSFLLWLAYLSADYVATFTLGRLALYVGDPHHHQLVLLWTPLLLLHLGSQETISAFSIEDAMLWKRHLLGLVTQVALAIYIMVKSWHPDKQLLAPLVLMFISGTIKYVERILALMAASRAMEPGGDSVADHVMDVQDDVIIDAKSYFRELHSIFPGKEVQDLDVRDGRIREADEAYQGLVMAAGEGLWICLGFLTDMTPFLVWSSKEDTIIERTVEKLRSSDPDTQVEMAYKLVEIQLSLIYDYMYTKYGALQFRLGLVYSVIARLITFCSTSVALRLFVGTDLKGPFNYRREDAMVSYVLLVGAVTLDISSIFKLISSYWLQLHQTGGLFGCVFSLVRFVNPWSKPLWSEKIPQYNLIDACIQEERGSIICGWVVRKTGIMPDIDMSKTVSPELKKLVLDKLTEVATTRSVSDYWDWDSSKYSGMWLQWWLQEGRIQDDIAQGILTDGITDTVLYFPMTVIVWHIATEMCWFADEDDRSPCRVPSMELSRYVMYLVVKRDVMSGTNGHFRLGKARRLLKRIIRASTVHDEKTLLRYVRQSPGVTEPCFSRGRVITDHLLKISNGAQRWELISMVWIEMLCYLGPNCGAQFHAKHLSTGGEFVTHVRILLVILGIPFLRSDMKPGKF
uniref:DUF4220 domain-containing protein n=1 Tax=Oryza nivara TaxID=4536 RepID=A0A0E0IQ83_ORYNI